GRDGRLALGQFQAVPWQAVQTVLHAPPGRVDAEVADRFALADEVDRECPTRLVGRWSAVGMNDLLEDGARRLGQAQRLLAGTVWFLLAGAVFDGDAVDISPPL